MTLFVAVLGREESRTTRETCIFEVDVNAMCLIKNVKAEVQRVENQLIP